MQSLPDSAFEDNPLYAEASHSSLLSFLLPKTLHLSLTQSSGVFSLDKRYLRMYCRLREGIRLNGSMPQRPITVTEMVSHWSDWHCSQVFFFSKSEIRGRIYREIKTIC